MSFGISVDNMDAVDFGMTTLGTVECPAFKLTEVYFDKPEPATFVDWIVSPKPSAIPYERVLIPTVNITVVNGQYKVSVSTQQTPVTLIILVR